MCKSSRMNLFRHPLFQVIFLSDTTRDSDDGTDSWEEDEQTSDESSGEYQPGIIISELFTT